MDKLLVCLQTIGMCSIGSPGMIIQHAWTPALSSPPLTKKRTMSLNTLGLHFSLGKSDHPEPPHFPSWSRCWLWPMASQCHWSFWSTLLWVQTDIYLSEFFMFLVLSFYSWGNREEVWRIMLNKEKTYLRDEHFLQRHPLLQARMRAVLLDWLMEVSLEVPAAGALPLLPFSVLLQSLCAL